MSPGGGVSMEAELERVKQACRELWDFPADRLVLLNRLEAYQIKRLLQLVEKEDQRRELTCRKAQRIISRFSGFAPRVDHSDEFPVDVTCAGCGTRMRVLGPGPYRCPKRDCAVLGEVRTSEPTPEKERNGELGPRIQDSASLSV